ncbi:MAG: metallophosphoesterase [Candidatus Aenigmarchaeota archaeon]|nr:metallophosphoesterase [Candidatus Aenigmarchaeota archaeon]
MKLLILADIHGEVDALKTTLQAGLREQPDAIIAPGNITDMFHLTPEFSQLDTAELIIQKLLAARLPVLMIPGNHDPIPILDLFEEYGVNLHAKRRILRGQAFAGFGGALTPFRTNFEPSEQETTLALERVGPAPAILVVHNPPKDTALDKLASGEHVGSPAVRAYIEKVQPPLVITAHIHEAAGQEFLGPSLLFNPGPAVQGRYGIVDLGPPISCRSLSVPLPREPAVAEEQPKKPTRRAGR